MAKGVYNLLALWRTVVLFIELFLGDFQQFLTISSGMQTQIPLQVSHFVGFSLCKKEAEFE